MKTKYLFVYLAAGAAFLIVSLWVFLSNGKSAKALRAKYVVGGLLLTSWAMFSAASCNGPFQVTCYEPAVTCYDVPAQTDMVSISIKDGSGIALKSGDVLVTNVSQPTYSKYRILITTGTEQPTTLQTGVFTAAEDSFELHFEMKLDATDYKGDARVKVFGIFKDNEGNERETEVGTVAITIL